MSCRYCLFSQNQYLSVETLPEFNLDDGFEQAMLKELEDLLSEKFTGDNSREINFYTWLRKYGEKGVKLLFEKIELLDLKNKDFNLEDLIPLLTTKELSECLAWAKEFALVDDLTIRKFGIAYLSKVLPPAEMMDFLYFNVFIPHKLDEENVFRKAFLYAAGVLKDQDSALLEDKLRLFLNLNRTEKNYDRELLSLMDQRLIDPKMLIANFYSPQKMVGKLYDFERAWWLSEYLLALPEKDYDGAFQRAMDLTSDEIAIKKLELIQKIRHPETFLDPEKYLHNTKFVFSKQYFKDLSPDFVMKLFVLATQKRIDFPEDANYYLLAHEFTEEHLAKLENAKVFFTDLIGNFNINFAERNALEIAIIKMYSRLGKEEMVDYFLRDYLQMNLKNIKKIFEPLHKREKDFIKMPYIFPKKEKSLKLMNEKNQQTILAEYLAAIKNVPPKSELAAVIHNFFWQAAVETEAEEVMAAIWQQAKNTPDFKPEFPEKDYRQPFNYVKTFFNLMAEPNDSYWQANYRRISQEILQAAHRYSESEKEIIRDFLWEKENFNLKTPDFLLTCLLSLGADQRTTKLARKIVKKKPQKLSVVWMALLYLAKNKSHSPVKGNLQ